MALRIAWYRAGLGGQDKGLWEELWNTSGWVDSIPDMRYFAEYPYCLRYLDPKGGPILDAGCGAGHYVVSLVARGFKVYGLDFSRETLRHLKTVRPTLKLQIGDVRSLPYDKNVFGGVLHFGVAEHFIEGPQCCIQESYRVLKPGGYFLLSVPYMNLLRKLYYPFYLLKSYVKRGDDTKYFYQYIFTKHEMVELLKNNGFELVDCSRIYYTTLIDKSNIIKVLRKYFIDIAKNIKMSDAHNNFNNVVVNYEGKSEDTTRIVTSKFTLKNGIENILNSIIGHFIILIARKV